jgi:hypothetical protein
MLARLLVAVIICAQASSAFAQARPTRFWNLTKHTVKEFYLSKPGLNQWGANQCKNDKDGAVDVDERLRITDAPPGQYDVRLIDVTGRVCLARDVTLAAGEVFSLEEKDLSGCSP